MPKGQNDTWVVKTAYGLGELKWYSQWKQPFMERRTYTCTTIPNLTLIYDGFWECRINDRLVRAFDRVDDAQVYACRLVEWIKANMEIVGDNMEHALNVAVGYWGMEHLSKAVNP